MGCGTGVLAVALANRGHRVTGADPAEAMLAIARKRPGGDQVTWVQAGAVSLALDIPFDLIIMTGHVFQVFVTDDDIGAALKALRRHLAPGGRLAFETRNPQAHAWEAWTPDKTRKTVAVPQLGTVAVHHDVTRAQPPLVTFDTCFHFENGDQVSAESTLRFVGQDALGGFLRDAGFSDVTWYGDWDRSAVNAASPELIAVAEV